MSLLTRILVFSRHLLRKVYVSSTVCKHNDARTAKQQYFAVKQLNVYRRNSLTQAASSSTMSYTTHCQVMADATDVFDGRQITNIVALHAPAVGIASIASP